MNTNLKKNLELFNLITKCLTTKVFVKVDQNWSPTTAKAARGVVIYLTCNSNLFFLSFLSSQLPSPRTEEMVTWEAHRPGPFKCTPFCFGGLDRLRGLGHLTTHPKISKYFKRSKESHFWRKIPVIIAPNFEIGPKRVFHAPCFCFTTGQGAENFITCASWVWKTMPYSNFPPVHLLQAGSLSGTAGPLRHRKHLLDKTWKCSTNLPNPRSH